MRTEGRLPPELAGVPFSATVARDSVVVVVRLSGELDMATEDKVAQVLDGVLATTPEVVRFDLSDVYFCDARGLAALVTVRRRLRSAQRRLELTGVPAHVRRLLAVTGLQDRLDVN
jgi:anti-sigma B factor antagonist